MPAERGPEEIRFVKYSERGSSHWREEFGNIFQFNLVQHSRYLSVLRNIGDGYETIVDWGCGDGALSYYLLKRCKRFIGVDTEPEGLDFFRQNLSAFDHKFTLYQPTDYYSVPEPDSSIDCIVCSEVVEHVQQPESLFSEFHRLLKPGGQLLVTTPYRLSETPNDPNHVREFYPAELRELVETKFPEVQIKLYQKVKYYGPYFLAIRRRPVGRYLSNILYKVFRYNPLMHDETTKEKWDLFTQIVAKARKGP